MKAMVLAAGRGERLKPLTLTRAKPAIPVLNIPMIVRTLNFLFKNGIEEAVVNLHHIPSSIKEAVKTGVMEYSRVLFSFEENLLGTAGGLKKVEEHFLDDTFLMINSDTLIEFNLKEMIAFHKKRGATATMLLSEPDENDSYGKICIDEQNRVVDILGKISEVCRGKQMNFVGVHIFEPEILKFIPPGKVSEINAEIYPDIIKKGYHVFGFENTNPWYDIGTLKRYLETQVNILKKGETYFLDNGHSGSNCLSRGIGKIDDSAEIAYSVLGKGCLVGKNSSISGSILLDNAEVCANAFVKDAIIEKGVRISEGERVCNCVKYIDHVTKKGNTVPI